MKKYDCIKINWNGYTEMLTNSGVDCDDHLTLNTMIYFSYTLEIIGNCGDYCGGLRLTTLKNLGSLEMN